MATQTVSTGDTAIAERDPFSQISNALSLFTGKTTTQTTGPSTQVTSSNMTPEQLNAIIQEAMAPANLASHASGMYGDTSLALARAQIAAQTAGKYAGQTQTNTGSTTTQKVQSPLGQAGGTLLGTLLAASMGNKALKSVGVDLADKLTGMLKGSKIAPDGTTGEMMDAATAGEYGGPAAEAAVGSAVGGETAATAAGGADALSALFDVGAGGDLLAGASLTDALTSLGADAAGGAGLLEGGSALLDAGLADTAGAALTDIAGATVADAGAGLGLEELLSFAFL
jgi:hypothetical protein